MFNEKEATGFIEATDIQPGNILSLFDLTGQWSKYYKENGYDVLQVDLQLGIDLMTWEYRKFPRNHFCGILIAEPCTDFARCGAKWFANKDSNGQTYESMALTYKSLAIVSYFNPGLRWWVMENPAGRIHVLCPDVGEIKLMFHPYEFAGWLEDPEPEQYAKETWLWGKFKMPVPKRMPCLVSGMDRHSQVGGKLIETKNFRSKTPMGFAYGFYLANK